MKTSKPIQILYKVVTLGLAALVVWATLGTPVAFAQTLELNRLADTQYTGTDNNRKKTCFLEVARVERDFANRRIQAFRIYTQESQLDLNLLLKGGQNRRTADFLLGDNLVQFNIAIEEHRLEIVSPQEATSQIKRIRLWGKSPTDAKDALIVDCRNMHKSR